MGCLWLPVLNLNQIQTRRDSDMRRQEEVEDGEMGLSKKKRESQRARGNFLEISANLPNGTLTTNVGFLFKEGRKIKLGMTPLPASTIGTRQIEGPTLS